VTEARKPDERSRPEIPGASALPLGAIEREQRQESEDGHGDVVPVDPRAIEQHDPCCAFDRRDAERHHHHDGERADAFIRRVAAHGEHDEQQHEAEGDGQRAHLPHAHAKRLEDTRFEQRVERHLLIIVALDTVVPGEEIGTVHALRRELVRRGRNPRLVFANPWKDA
jgi:hypothetical protein